MKRLVSTLLATTLAVGLSGCLDVSSYLPGNSSGKDTAVKPLSPEEMELLKENFPYDIDPQTYSFNRDGGPTYDFAKGTSPRELAGDDKPFFEVFIDKELTMQVKADLSFVERGTYMLRPIQSAEIFDVKRIISKDGEFGKFLYKYEDWGSLDRVYVLQRKDTETGKDLERPKLAIHMINKNSDSYLAAPQANLKLNDQGGIEMKWNEVPGATEYAIVKTRVVVGELPDPEIRIHVVGYTKDTSWRSSDLDEDAREDVKSTLMDRAARVDDDLYSPYPDEKTINGKNKENAFLAVMAFGGNKQSGLSNRFSLDSINNQLAFRTANWTIEKAMKHSERHFLIYDSLEDLPEYFPFIMLSGATKFFPLLPQVEETKETSKGLKVKLTSPAADYSGVVTVISYPQDWKGFLEKRKDKLKDSKGGAADSPEFEVIADPSKQINLVVDEVAQIKSLKPGETPFGEKIFATNPLSYRISQGLIFNHKVVDLAGIPGAEDEHLVRDAFDEAMVQTGSTSLIALMRYYPNQKIEISYKNYNQKERSEAAAQSREKLREALKGLQLDGLNPLEKVRKINRWIIDNTEYDYEALKRTDDPGLLNAETEAAWTIAGTALYNKAVCQGYAKAFIFMTREAGLESMAVTGNINGSNSEGHMWAAVKLDGKWRYFDPTWNDAPGQEEVYFNLELDDPVITKTHTTDNDYLLDSQLKNYK